MLLLFRCFSPSNAPDEITQLLGAQTQAAGSASQQPGPKKTVSTHCLNRVAVLYVVLGYTTSTGMAETLSALLNQD
jgi:hypothetical protein